MIPLSIPTVTGNEIEYVRRCIEDGWLSSAGPMVDEFEARLVKRTGRAHAVALSSGTAALHLSLLAAGVKPGDLVVTQSFSFIATVNAIKQAGADPLFVDSDPDSWIVSAAKLSAVFDACSSKGKDLIHTPTGRRIAAVMPVPIFGLLGGMEKIESLCADFGIPLVVDAAEAMGARHAGRAAESFGIASSLSFNGNKIMTTGSGGVVLTDDADIAARCRHLSTQAKTDTLDHIHDEIGFNYRMAAVNAAVGLGQLDAVDDFLLAKERIAKTYRDAFAEYENIQCMPMPIDEPERPWLFSICLINGDGRAVVQKLNKAGIGARRLWRPLHMQEAYKNSPQHNTAFSTSDHLFKKGLSLPTSVSITDDQLRNVIKEMISVSEMKLGANI